MLRKSAFRRTRFELLGLLSGISVLSIYAANSLANHHNPIGSPDPTKAYLIISSNLVPSDRRQPTWIAISSSTKDEHLSTSDDIFELPPALYRIIHLDFGERRATATGTIDLRTELYHRLVLEPGKIYYYGRLEIEQQRQKTIVRVVRDSDVYRRACELAPELFSQFDLVPIGPALDFEVRFVPCAELLNTEPT